MAEKNITQAKLNDLAGYKSNNVVNKIVKGKRQATATDLLRFSKILDEPAEVFGVN